MTTTAAAPSPPAAQPGLLGRIWRRPPLVAVVRLTGLIGQGGSLRRGLSLAGVAGPLDRAFAAKRTAAVALAINSPGGAPVQTALIARRIRDLSEERGVPVYAFVEDVAASGGFWLACAADEIYADAGSIVGSIGVISAGFGFDRLIARWDVDRRVYTAGTRKALLDPFRPENEEDVALLTSIQADLHRVFRDYVEARRGDRLTPGDEPLFDGRVWAGERAQALGLIDGVGQMRPILRQKFGDKVRLKLVGEPRGLLRRRLGFDQAETLPEAALAAAEERLAWARFGL